MTEAALLASTLAALISRSIMHPMDTLRLRLQVGDNSTEKKSVKIVGNTTALRNLASLYSGYSIAVGFTIPGLAVFLTSYDLSKSAIARYTPFKTEHMLNHCMSGFVAQGLAGLVFNPMEVVKGYMQTRKAIGEPLLIRQIVKSIYQTQGLLGFFRGYWLSVAVFGPHNILYFAAYEKAKSWLQLYQIGKQLETKHFLLASSVATLLGATVTHPIDVLRARYQVYNTTRSMVSETQLGTRMSVQQFAYHIWRNEGGIRPFTRGMFYRIGYLVPSTAISMTMFETFKPFFLQLLKSSPSTDHVL